MCTRIYLIYNNCKTIRTKPHKIGKVVGFCENGIIKENEESDPCNEIEDIISISSRIPGDCPECNKLN